MRFYLSHAGITRCIGGALLTVLYGAVANYGQHPFENYRVFDECGRVCWEDEQARLDNFALRLEWPEQIGNIAVYDGRRACRGEAIARAMRAKKYIVGRRNIGPNRVLWRFGGYREDLTVVLMDIPRGYPEWPPNQLSRRRMSYSSETATTVYDQRAVYDDGRNKSLHASRGSVFLKMLISSMWPLPAAASTQTLCG